MSSSAQPSSRNFSLLTVIVSRGKGSRVLQFASVHGARKATGFLGKGTIQNGVLKFLSMDDIEREIILILVPAERELEFLKELNKEFHFDKPNHGIAFALPLTGVLKLGSGASYKPAETKSGQGGASEYSAVFLVVNNGMAETVVQISQNAGYYGGTIIKASGSATAQSFVLGMHIEPKKEAVLLLTESHRAQRLADLLSEELNLGDANTGILVMFEISRTIGLYAEGKA